MLVADFSNARVGDRVKTVYGFEGEIIKKTNWSDATKQRWVMEFEQLNGGNLSFEFDDDGYAYSHGYKYSKLPIVFYQFEGQWPTIEACTRPLPEIEVDDKVLVYQHGEWVNAYFSEFRGSYIATFLDGKTEWTNGIEAGRANNSFWKTADGKYDSGNLEEIE